MARRHVEQQHGGLTESPQGYDLHSAEIYEPMRPWEDRIASHWKRRVNRCRVTCSFLFRTCET